MNDRVPTYPGRVRLVPVSGQTNIYDLTMADDPTQEGTPLNKANLLTDTTAVLIAALTGTTPGTPNEALSELATAFSDALIYEIVEYTGTHSTTKTITFDEKPDAVLIYRTGSVGVGDIVWLLSPIWGDYTGAALCWSQTLGNAYSLGIAWSGNSLTISATEEAQAFNYLTVKYKAIGIRFGA